jgi:hypothetical protein
MVGHEIQNEIHSPFREFVPRHGQPGRASQVFVNNVPPHAIGRSDIVLRLEIGQRSAEIV